MSSQPSAPFECVLLPPEREEERLRALDSYRILDTPTEPLFDGIAQLAADICDAPIGVVNFIGEGRQWFKAEVGIGARELPLDVSICRHAILQPGLFVVPDLTKDSRFEGNPLVQAVDGLRFYAGALLETPDGLPLGTVCVLDTKARPGGIAERQGRILTALARQVMSELELRRAVAQRDAEVARTQASEARLRDLNATLEQRVEERTRERDRIWKFSHDLLAVAAADGALQVVNPAWTATLGWTEEELLGTPLIGFVHPDDRERTLRASARVIAGEKILHFENRYRTRSGDYRWLSWRAIPAEGWIYATARDVTEEKRRQAELAAAQEQLRQSQKMEAMGQLTGGVAHDFNNLLTPIVGSLDLLQRRGLGDARAQRMIEGALTSAERARTLVQRLLAFARRQPLRPAPIDLGQLVANMADLVDSTTGPRVRVLVEVAAELPAVLADPNQLEMAVLNLAVNARDAMPDGGTLSLTAEPAEIGEDHRTGLAGGRYVRLSVGDTGIGMDEATLARAVEPFFSTKGIGKGTGLGLSMVHGLAAQLGGALTLRSRPGLGTCVELWLPLAGEAAPDEQRDGGAELPCASGTALVVDDEELVRASTADMLSDLGYSVVEAESAEEALKMVERGLAPDLVITDHLMPGMTGGELAQAMTERRPGTPVLLVSGYADVEDLPPSVPRLTKPFRLADLSESLAALEPARN